MAITREAKILANLPLPDERTARTFLDFYIAELDDYASCIIEIADLLEFTPYVLHLNRITKEFVYKLKPHSYHTPYSDFAIHYLRFEAFLQYLFNLKEKACKFWSLFYYGKDTNLTKSEIEYRLDELTYDFCSFLCNHRVVKILEKHALVNDLVKAFFLVNKIDLNRYREKYNYGNFSFG